MPRGKPNDRDLDANGWVKFDLKAAIPPPRDLSVRSIYGGMIQVIREKLPFANGDDPQADWFQITGAWDDQEAAHAVSAIRDYFKRSHEIRVEITRRGSQIYLRKLHAPN